MASLTTEQISAIPFNLAESLYRTKTSYGKWNICGFIKNADDNIITKTMWKNSAGVEEEQGFMILQFQINDPEVSAFNAAETPKKTKLINSVNNKGVFEIIENMLNADDATEESVLETLAKAAWKLDLEMTKYENLPPFNIMRKNDKGELVVGVRADGRPFSPMTNHEIIRIRDKNGNGENRSLASLFTSDMSRMCRQGAWATGIDIANVIDTKLKAVGGDITLPENDDDALDNSTKN